MLSNLHASNTLIGYFALSIFVIAYILVIAEERMHLRKSKPVILSAGLIWLIVAIVGQSQNASSFVHLRLQQIFLEYSELFFFLLVAITYVNAMEERQIFAQLKALLQNYRLTFKQLFWLTGILSFVLSGILDNLTTALVMGTVVLNVGQENKRFVQIGCINIVVAANAGGAFTPFGDITTLMVWQKGILPFQDFFKLALPAFINFLIPAVCMHYSLPSGSPTPIKEVIIKSPGGMMVGMLFLFTLITTIVFHHFFHLPAVLGMMTGLGYLQFFSYYSKMNTKYHPPVNVFKELQRTEWDTLLFFYGVMVSVGGLSALGYLETLSTTLYKDWAFSNPIWQHTFANTLIGILSAIVDNIPIMYSVLTMHPTMSEGQWLLVTLTAGVGGSLLSLGSAAGVALMGQSNNLYTFSSHLKWTWAIGLGYIASILCHHWWNAELFMHTLSTH